MYVCAWDSASGVGVLHFVPFVTMSHSRTPFLPTCPIQELCDAGTLAKAIKAGMFSGEREPAPSRQHKLMALLRTAREVARGV